MEFNMKAIGVIHIPFIDPTQTPIQSARSDVQGMVEVYPPYLDGLEGIDGFSHIYLLYGFHRSDTEVALRVQPYLDDQTHGLFTTRYPCRPNPIGLSVVRLVKQEKNVLYFIGADMLDGTPLLDIKPYIPEFDVFPVDKTGWYQHRKHA